MTEIKSCPKCGGDLPQNAPAGICPKCLMAAGLESNAEGGSSFPMNPTTAISGFVPPAPEVLKDQFPQLEILELLGKGGMGAVYKARQPGLDRLVAVKILPTEIGADPAFAGRFTREARALAKLSHQNIVSVFDFGQADGQYYFIMEYVDGANLRQLIQAGNLMPEEALAIVPQICDALQFAHNEGIVHRDIKPENILVDKLGRVKIADFGLAKLFGKAPAEATLTAAHQVMGTLHYMAPEQMRGAGAVDHRADIFSLGVVFYEMLTGQLPIGKFEPPSKKVQIDVRLDEVVLRALESEPERRYQRAAELKHDTQRVASSAAIAPSAPAASESETSDPHEAAARRLRNPMAALFVVGLAQLILALGLSAWLGATLTRIHAAPATPQTSGDKDATGDGMTVTVSPHPWRPFLGWLYGLMGVTVASTVIGLLAMTAAVWGSQLQMERFVRTACGLVCLPSPVWPFGLPTALVAFSALSRPNVRSAFAGVAEQDELEPRPSILSHWSVWTIVGIAAAILVMATSFVPWMKLNIFGITQTAIGADTWHGIVVCVAGGAAALLVAGFATCGGSRLGQGLSAIAGGLAAAAVAGYFAWEVVQPLKAQATSSVTGDASLQDFGQGMADAFTDLFTSAIQQRPTFGIYAALVCGALLALVGTGQLVAPLFRAAGGDELKLEPRLSRKAILGFCWAPFFFVLVISATLPVARGPSSASITNGSVTVTSDRPAGEAESVTSMETAIANQGERMVQELLTGKKGAPTETINANQGATRAGPAWWQWALIVTIVPLGLTAPFGATILGIVSINDIRHSHGRLTGLPLALTDSLLYPLLLLDGLTVCGFWMLCMVACEILGAETPPITLARLSIGVTTLLSLPACAYVDFRIIKAAWRKICLPPGK